MPSRANLLRAFDANSNRAREGLRVCEDLVRFWLGDTPHFKSLRSLRRFLDDLLASMPFSAGELVKHRDSGRDPGRRVYGGPVRSVEHLLVMNLQRTKEALRVLEETCRLVSPKHVSGFQKLRYTTYDVEKALLLKLASLRHR